MGMATTRTIRTRIRINHLERGADGRATKYQGHVLRGQRIVATTFPHTDGIACLRDAQRLEVEYLRAQS